MQHPSSNAAPYQPPSASTIASRQNDAQGLRLLLAQRRYYDRAKRWSMLHDAGTAVVAVAAPLTAGFVPSTALVAGAIAGGWVFLARTLFHWLERADSMRGAVVQEMFDQYIFDMPSLAARGTGVSPEDIQRRVRSRLTLNEQVAHENLSDWYPIRTDLDGVAVVAIAQRTNAAYAERLLYLNASILLGILVGWIVAAVGVGILAHFSLEVFLIGMALPLLPVLLDSWNQQREVKRASADRRALAAQIGDVIGRYDADNALPHLLLLWQDQLFSLRRDAPQIPNFVYKRTRESNERTMSEVAGQLADKYKARNEAQ